MEVNMKDTSCRVDFYQYDFGQVLEFSKGYFDNNTEVHYYQDDIGCKEVIHDGIAKIPEYMLSKPMLIVAYIYENNDISGNTRMKLLLYVQARDKPPDYVEAEKPENYTRLLPVGGEPGKHVTFNADGIPILVNLDNEFASDKELVELSERMPIAMNIKEILEICK